MEVQEMRQVFIDSAVRVVARDGLEKATTKAIAAEAGLNEAYIYKCFAGKDELLSEAFYRGMRTSRVFCVTRCPLCACLI